MMGRRMCLGHSKQKDCHSAEAFCDHCPPTFVVITKFMFDDVVAQALTHHLILKQ